jgi:hypothetical protein
LRCELVEVKMNNEFLLKAIGFFSLEQREKKNSNRCSHQGKANYSITRMARLLIVPVSGVYE